MCLSDVLSKWKQGVTDDDVMITHNPLEKLESPFLAFVGKLICKTHVSAPMDAMMESTA